MATTRSTASKPAARKPSAHFSIAQAERERDKGLDDVEPFTVEMKTGDVITMRDPRKVGWQVAGALDLSNSFGTMRELVEADDWEAFVAEDFDFEILKILVKSWREHYGMNAEDFEGN